MSAFLCISTLLNSNIPHDYFISFLNRVESTNLKQYLRYANIYTGSKIKSKHELIEMIMYGFMCNKINDIPSIEVSDKHKFKKITEKCNIGIKKLPGYGNCNKRKESWSIISICKKGNHL